MNSFNKRAIFKLSLFPLIALAVILATPLPLYFFLKFAYFYYMPLIVFFAGFAVIFIGLYAMEAGKVRKMGPKTPPPSTPPPQ